MNNNKSFDEKMIELAERIYEAGCKEEVARMAMINDPKMDNGLVLDTIHQHETGKIRYCLGMMSCCEMLFRHGKLLSEIFNLAVERYGGNEKTDVGNVQFIYDISGYKGMLSRLIEMVECIEVEEAEKRAANPKLIVMNAQIVEVKCQRIDDIKYRFNLRLRFKIDDTVDLSLNVKISDQLDKRMKKIMDIVGAADFMDLPGAYCRIQIDEEYRQIEKIGHILENKWLDCLDLHAKEA